MHTTEAYMRRTVTGLTTALALTAILTIPAFAGGANIYNRCKGCHGNTGNVKAMGTGEIIQGQSAQDIKSKLMGYKDGSYGFGKKKVMVNIVKGLSEVQMQEVSDYIATF